MTRQVQRAVVCAAALVLWSRAAGAGVMDREFHYAPQRFGTVESGDLTEVRVKGAVSDFTPGRPDLPWVIETIEVPAGQRVTAVELTSYVTVPMGRAARMASTLKLEPGATTISRTAPDPEWFSRSGFQPEKPVRLGYQGWKRGANLVSIEVCPVRWDATSGQLERATRVGVRLVLGGEMSAPLPRLRAAGSARDGRAAAETSAPSSRQAQPFKATQIPSLLGSPVEYVIITSDEMQGEFQRLADWKTQSGIPAVVRTMSFIRQEYPSGADDAERIRDFIRDAYSRWGTQWVLLGGDTEVIPTRYAYTTYYYGGEYLATDLYYSCLDGNWNGDGDAIYGEALVDGVDLLPEVWVGRAPAITVDEAARFVDKSLQYVREPAGDYENQVLMFAEVLFPPNWSPGSYIILDGASLAEALLPSLQSNPSIHYARLYENDTDTLWQPGALHETKAMVLDSLNQGYNVCVHIGHGFRNVMSVGDANLDNNDALGLHNGNRLFNLYASNCTSNAIDFPCIGEAYLHAPNGGAVTNIGASNLEFPAAGRYFQERYFELLYEDSITAVGEAQAEQKVPYVGASSSDNAYRWTQFAELLLGDPELRIYTGLPRVLSVSHPGSVVFGDTSISVHVETAQGPLQGARVVAYKLNDEYRAGTTDAAGDCVLPFRPDQAGSFYLTVTGFDCQPYQALVNLTTGISPVLGDLAPIVDDDSIDGTIGNGDGIVDAGETVDLRIPVRNNGATTASSVNGTLSCLDPWVTVVSPNVSYGSLSPGAISNPSPGFRVSVSPNTPDQFEAAFHLELVDGAARSSGEDIQVVIHAPELRHLGHDVSDVGGDDDGRPDPGETVSYFVTLRNQGTAPAIQVTALLRNYDGLATISDSTASWADLAPGAELQGDALVFVPSSTSAILELRVSDQYGERFVQQLDLGAPQTPDGLAGVGNSGSIRLTWNKCPDADLLGYNLFRSLAEGGPFDKITPVPTGRVAYYLDGGLQSLTRYYYQVSAVDSSGNESDRSVVAAATTSPPTHDPFPFILGRDTPSSVAVDHIYPEYPLDMVAGSDRIYVWHPDGTAPVDADGSALTTGDFSLLGSYYAAGPSIGDLDDDSVPEIVAPTWDSQALYVFDLAGQPKMGWPATVNVPIWSSAALGDLDNNGTRELVFGSNGTKIYAFRADGTEWMDGDSDPGTVGVFKVLGAGFNVGTPALADLDGNGQLDIVVGSFDGKLYAWRPDGSDLPGFPVTLAGPITASVAIGYLDGPADTELDVVVPTGEYSSGVAQDSLYVIRANGQRRAGWPVSVSTHGNSRTPSPALADIDGDTYVDVIAAGTDGVLHVFDRNGADVPPFTGIRYSQLTGIASESSPVVADIDGDGVDDIVVGDDNGSLSAFSGSTAMPLPGFPITISNSVKGTPALCDCDADGMTEVLLAGWDAEMHVWDYDFPFSPGREPPWPQFHHDARRTGFLGSPAFVGVDDEAPADSRALEFAPPVPNPAHLATRIAYAVPAERAGAPLEVSIYDLSGRRVRTIEQGLARPGRHSASWNLRDEQGTPVQAGIYLVHVRLGPERRSQKLVVLR